MAGGKRKGAQGKTLLKAKKTKFEEDMEDIDDFLKDLNVPLHDVPENKNVEENNPEMIKYKIKESIFEEFTAIQVAVNTTFEIKNKELRKKDEELNKLSDEKNNMIDLWNKYDEERDKKIKNIEELLKNAKEKLNEPSVKGNQQTVDKLTANVENLLKQNKVLLKQTEVLKDEVETREEDVKVKENGIQECRNAQQILAQKLEKLQMEQIAELKKLERQRWQDKTKMELKDKLQKEQIAEQDIKLQKLEVQRMQDITMLQEKLKIGKLERKRFERAFKDDKDKHKNELESKDMALERALESMQKLIDAEKKLSNKFKLELKSKDQELSTIGIKNKDLSQKLGTNEMTIKTLEEVNSAIKKKSYGRKIKLKCAQQSYESNLKDFMQKYEKNIERMKKIKDKLKRRKKKVLNLKSVKLILGGKSVEKSFTKDVDENSFVIKQFDGHSRKEILCLDQEKVPDDLLASKKEASKFTEARDSIINFSDHDVPSTSQNHLQQQNNMDKNLYGQEIETESQQEATFQTPPKMNEFNSFILWDESAFPGRKEQGAAQEKENILIGFDLESQTANSDVEDNRDAPSDSGAMLNLLSTEEVLDDSEANKKVDNEQKRGNEPEEKGNYINITDITIQKHALELEDSTFLLMSDNIEQIDQECSATLEELDDHHIGDRKINTQETEFECIDEQQNLLNNDLESSENGITLAGDIIELILLSLFSSNNNQSTHTINSDYDNGPNVNESVNDTIAKTEDVTENTDNVTSRWYDGAKEKIFNAPTDIPFREEYELRDLKFTVADNVNKCLRDYYNNPEAILGQYKIKEEEQFKILCKMFSYRFREEIKEMFVTFNGSCLGINLTPDNKRFIRDQIDMFLESLQLANRSRQYFGNQIKAKCVYCEYLDNSWGGVLHHFEHNHKGSYPTR